jgi:hypothetical protein
MNEDKNPFLKRAYPSIRYEGMALIKNIPWDILMEKLIMEYLETNS